MPTLPTEAALADALVAAAEAHHEYEVNALHGVRDELWAGFYAAYVLGRLGDFMPATQLAHLLESAPEASAWVPSAAAYVFRRMTPEA